MKKKPTKKKYELVHNFYSRLERMIDELERRCGKKLEVQINIKK